MSQVWVETEAIAPLEAGVIDLYATTIEEHFDRLDLLFNSLSNDEQVRAKRYRYDKDYNQFVVARGLLRRLLGKYLGLAPEAVVFTYGSMVSQWWKGWSLIWPIQGAGCCLGFRAIGRWVSISNGCRPWKRTSIASAVVPSRRPRLRWCVLWQNP
ncbi:MAG: hypothetical protein HC860_13755 [Alkalinema sp. RU_4_3]|nr:hypothetical protein [Alkalinema sp. RU_4_3]